MFRNISHKPALDALRRAVAAETAFHNGPAHPDHVIRAASLDANGGEWVRGMRIGDLRWALEDYAERAETHAMDREDLTPMQILEARDFMLCNSEQHGPAAMIATHGAIQIVSTEPMKATIHSMGPAPEYGAHEPHDAWRAGKAIRSLRDLGWSVTAAEGCCEPWGHMFARARGRCVACGIAYGADAFGEA